MFAGTQNKTTLAKNLSLVKLNKPYHTDIPHRGVWNRNENTCPHKDLYTNVQGSVYCVDMLCFPSLDNTNKLWYTFRIHRFLRYWGTMILSITLNKRPTWMVCVPWSLANEARLCSSTSEMMWGSIPGGEKQANLSICQQECSHLPQPNEIHT